MQNNAIFVISKISFTSHGTIKPPMSTPFSPLRSLRTGDIVPCLRSQHPPSSKCSSQGLAAPAADPDPDPDPDPAVAASPAPVDYSGPSHCPRPQLPGLLQHPDPFQTRNPFPHYPTHWQPLRHRLNPSQYHQYQFHQCHPVLHQRYQLFRHR
mmetsp:Transcript_8958/g.11166  ORF Transcript_8958/g.11166 Transcript_8958/m.11166 type:complete len:153 (-) Transcript_8958:358-816(-)